jgi:hypothetical protein
MGGVDFARYNRFRHGNPEEYRAIKALGAEIEIHEGPHSTTRNDVALFMEPRLFGYSCIDVGDLTAVELEGRRLIRKQLDFYRAHMPGFENAWILDSASQMGTRHSRRLIGVKKVTRAEWLTGKVHEDEVAVSPPRNPKDPNVSIPLGCLVPVTLENLLAAGRNLSSDTASHTFLRLIPQAWEVGQAAGVAAAVAVGSGTRVRQVDVREVQRQLLGQGVYLSEPSLRSATPEPLPG